MSNPPLIMRRPVTGRWQGKPLRAPLSERLLYVRGEVPIEVEILPCGDMMHFRYNGHVYFTRIGKNAVNYFRAIKNAEKRWANGKVPNARIYQPEICKRCKLHIRN